MSEATESALELNTRVEVRGIKGYVRFIGTAAFAPGKWVGVELDTPDGKNDGSVQGKSYFTCAENHGVFVRQAQVTVIDSNQTATATPTPAAPAAAPVPTTSIPAPTATTATTTAATTTTPAASTTTTSAPAPAPTTTTAAATTTTTTTTIPTTTTSYQGTDKEVFLLREKVTSLEAKRNEDKERMKELEKFRALYDQMVEYKTKWAQAQLDLQQQLKEAKKEAKEAIEAKEKLEAEVVELSESTELAMLDKEMAEEKVESLQNEIQTLKDKVEELKLDLDIIKGEQEEKNEAAITTASGLSTAEIKQLEAQNERLKEALVRLRDLASTEKSELTAKVQALEKDAGLASVLKEKNAKLAEDVARLESEVVDLKQAVDDAMGAAEMVEKLTDANLNLEEKVQSLTEMVDDLEALRDLSDELEENHIATERQLQGEIDMCGVRANELQRALDLSQETIADQEESLGKYRELVRSLQSDLQELQKKEVSQREETKELASQSQSLLSLNLQLQTTAQKAHARAVDLELRKLDAQQSTELCDIFRQYLPNSFFKTEYDAIKTVLLFKRLLFKSQLALTQIRQQFSLDKELKLPTFVGDEPAQQAASNTTNETIQSHLAALGRRENMSFAYKLSSKLVDLCHIFNRFIQILQTCEVDLYFKLGFMFTEFAAHEKKLDAIIELVRRELINETVPLEGLDKSISQLCHHASNYLPSASQLQLQQQPQLQLQQQQQQQQQQQHQQSQQQSQQQNSFSPAVQNLLQNLNDTDMLEWRCETIAMDAERSNFGISLLLTTLALLNKPTAGDTTNSATNIQLFEGLSQIFALIQQSIQNARRIVRKLPGSNVNSSSTSSGSNNNNNNTSSGFGNVEVKIALNPQHRERLWNLNNQFSVLANFIDQVCSTLLSSVDSAEALLTISPTSWLEYFDNNSSNSFILIKPSPSSAALAPSSSGSIPGSRDDIASPLPSTLAIPSLSTIFSYTQQLAQYVAEFSTALQKGDLDDTSAVTGNSSGGNSIAPWVYRAQVLKDELDETAAVKEKLALKSEEVISALTALKLKEKELGDSHLKVETLEKRIAQMKTEFERQEDVKGQLDAANNQIKKLQETVDVLHADIEVYEKDISDLQKQIKLLKRGGTGVNTGGSATPLGQNPSVATPALQVAIDNLGATGLPSVGPSPLGSPKHRSQQYDSSGSGATAPASIIVKYETQLEILESALRHLKLENAQLKGDMVKSTLDSLTPLNIPPVYNELKANPEERKDKLSEASANLSKLVTTIQDKSSSVRVVRLGSKEAKNNTVNSKLSLISLQKLTNQLCEQSVAAIHSEVPGSTVSTHLTTFSNADLSKQLSLHIGKITLPELGALNNTKNKSLTLNPKEFERLHSVFVS